MFPNNRNWNWYGKWDETKVNLWLISLASMLIGTLRWILQLLVGSITSRTSNLPSGIEIDNFQANQPNRGRVGQKFHRERTLTLLDPVQNAAIRICTGAFHTSPALSLCTVSGYLPLHYRRLNLTASLLTSILQPPNTLVHDMLFNSLCQTIINSISAWLFGNSSRISLFKFNLVIFEKKSSKTPFPPFFSTPYQSSSLT